MKFIPTFVHGVLDYVIGIALFFAPNIFGFSEVGGAAVLIPQMLGAGIVLYSLVTNYELGIIKLLPMKGHLAVDFAGSALLALSPFLFGFSDQPMNAWLPHMVVGIVVFLESLFTQTEPKASAKK